MILVPIHPPLYSTTHVWISISNYRLFRQFLNNICRRLLTTEVTSMRGDSIKFPVSLETATQKRLDRLLTEVAYDGGNPDMTFDEKLAVRRVAAVLAATLCNAN